MTLRDIISVLDNSGMVVYSGWQGDNDTPIFEETYGNLCFAPTERLATFLAKYGNRQVCCIEAVGEYLYVWIDEEEVNNDY